jgi:hypothetical protein
VIRRFSGENNWTLLSGFSIILGEKLKITRKTGSSQPKTSTFCLEIIIKGKYFGNIQPYLFNWIQHTQLDMWKIRN